jgi:hypothetical protein
MKANIRKIIRLVLLALPLWGMGNIAHAQKVYICKDGDYITKDISEGLEIDLTNQPDSITFTKPKIDPVVNIVYNGTTATVSIPMFLADTVTCSSGSSSNVVLTYAGTEQEIIYNVSGNSSAGSLVIKSEHKMTVNLNGVNLTSTLGEALRFKCGKRTELVLAKGSVNTFADTNDNGLTADPTDSHKACIYTKGHLEISGAGTLNVTGNYHHAIATKEYMKVKKTVNEINILGSVGDAIHAGQYFQINGGTINIDKGTLGDGIQAEFKTDDLGAIITDDEENTGEVIINGGTINAIASATQDTKCIKADGNVTINSGTLQLDAIARGSRGIQTDGSITINQDEDATTSITITAQGAKCNLEEDEDDPHKCMGINVDGDINISGGTINITASGTSSNGMKADKNITVSGGNIDITVQGTSANGMRIGKNATFTGGTTTVTQTKDASKSQGIVYSGTRTVEAGATVSASWTQKK